MDTAKQVVDALSALAQEHRLALFRLLVQAGSGGMAAGTIADAMAMPASTLSFHLAQMERADIVVRIRKGRSLIYSANYAAMSSLIGYLTENCCGSGENCAPAVCTTSQERTAA